MSKQATAAVVTAFPLFSPLSLPPLSLSLLSPSLSSFLPLSPLSLSSLPSVAVEVHSLRGRLHEPTDDLEGGVPPAVSHGSQLSLGSSLTRPVSPDLSQQVCLSLPNQSYLASSLSLPSSLPLSSSDELVLLHQLFLRGLHHRIDQWPVVMLGMYISN